MSQLLWDLVRTVFGRPNEVHIDTQILRLHSRVSFRVFLICSVLLTFRQVINSDDIMCFDHGTSKDEDLNAFCWIHSTYSVTELFHSCTVKKDCIYPGVGQLKRENETRVHTYYQWTSACLCLQAFICYVPRFIWKFCENGIQKMLSFERKLFFYPIIPPKEDEQVVKQHFENLVNYLKTHTGQHQSYFFKYWYQFLSYGSDAVKYWLYSNPDEVSPMIKVFPLMAKCTPPRRYGASGNIISPDPVCILPLNSLNDKIYIFLWFYLLFVSVVSALSFLYRVSTILFPQVRYILLRKASGAVKAKVVEDLSRRCYVGDWFLLCILRKNVSATFYQELLEAYWEVLLNRKLSV